MSRFKKLLNILMEVDSAIRQSKQDENIELAKELYKMRAEVILALQNEINQIGTEEEKIQETNTITKMANKVLRLFGLKEIAERISELLL